jgi:hypothetical protein
MEGHALVSAVPEEELAEDSNARGLQSLFAKSSRLRRLLFFGGILFQGLFCLCFFASTDVHSIPTVWLVFLCLSAACFLLCSGFMMLTARPQQRLMIACVYGASFAFALLFASWLQLFGVAAVYEIYKLTPPPGSQARVLSGFVILLVYSTDVFEALDHVRQHESKALIPIIAIVLMLVVVSLLQHIYPANATSLYFEIALTALILLMHLFAGILHEERLSFLVFALVVSFICLGALCASTILVVFDYENIADVVHRCVDVLLLIESHWVRTGPMRAFMK